MVYQAWKEFDGDKVVATSPFSEKAFDFIPPNGKVLDLGCGNGRISKVLKDRGYQTYGIDINEDAIRFAKSNPELHGIDFSVQDAKATTYQDLFFDGVIEQAVLACMEKPDRCIVLSEIYRILKSGGIFSLAEFGLKENREEKYKADAEVTGEYGTMIVRREDGTELFRSHNFTKEELDTLLKEAGFVVLKYMNPYFTTFSGKSQLGHQYIVQKI